jgi:hypothetical protein
MRFGGGVIFGGVLSVPLTVMINVAAPFIELLVAEQKIEVFPIGNKEPETGLHVEVTELPLLVAVTVYPTLAPLEVMAD